MSTHSRLSLSLLLLAALQLPARPDNEAPSPTQPVSLGSIAEQVRSANPELAAARLRLLEAEGRWRQSGVRENPELETGFENDSDLREWRAEIGVSLRFPLSDRLKREKSSSYALLQAVGEEIRQQERILATAGLETVVEILALRERRAGLLRQQVIARELFAYLDGLAVKGEASPLDAGQARIEASALEAEVRRLDAQESQTLGRLRLLLGRAPEEPLEVQGVLPSPEAGAPVLTDAEPSAVKAKRLEGRAARETAALEEGRSRGDLEAGFFVAGERAEDAPDGFDEEMAAGFRLSIPLPLLNRNEGAIAAAHATADRIALEADAMAGRLQIEAATARAEMERWAALVAEIDQNILPATREQERLTADAHRAGQVDLQAVLRLREKELQLSAARLDALREYHLARVRRDAAIGQP